MDRFVASAKARYGGVEWAAADKNGGFSGLSDVQASLYYESSEQVREQKP